MKITKLHLKNFRQFEDLEINFSKTSNIAVFIGENGCGKSTVLDAISKMLAQFIRQQYYMEYKNQNSYLNKEDSNLNNTDNIYVELRFSTENKDLYIKNGDVYRSGITYDSNIQIDYDKDIFYFITAYRNNADRMVFQTNNGNFLDSIAEENRMNRIENQVADIYETALNIILTDITSTRKPFEEWFLQLENTELQTIFDTKNFNYRLPELQIFRNTIKTFYNNLSETNFEQLKGNREKGGKIMDLATQWVELKKGNIFLKLNQLSTGEQAMLMLVTDITRRLLLVAPNLENIEQQSGIVLIDEIDQHLHPKWQRRILPALAKTFPNVQFIVTTHSPQVLSGAPNGSVFGLKDGKVYHENTFGRDNNWILQVVMDDEERPREIKEQLETYFGYIRNGQETEAVALRNELETLLGSDEPEFVKADILMRRKFSPTK